MQFGILGPLLFSVGGRERRVPPGRQRGLLTLLLLHARQTVSADLLIDVLWGEELPDNPANALQGRISQLRKLLNGSGGERVLVQQGAGYCLNVAPESIDAHRFEQLARAGHEALAEEAAGVAAEVLHEALSLWRGPALEDVADELWAAPEAQRLNELRLAATEDRVRADLALGRHGPLVAELEELVAAHPLREALRRHLMVALYRAGRQADALAAYQRGKELLADELGIDPDPASRELEERILRQDPTLDWRPAEDAQKPPPGVGVELAADAIRVFLVDDHTVVRRGMAAFLDQVDDLVVVGQAGDGDEALEALSDLDHTDALPDVVLMDVLMPRLDGITATEEITRRHPGVRVVAVTSFTEIEKVHGALAAGAAGYLLKHAEADEVAMAIRAAHRGDVHLDSTVAVQLAKSLRVAKPQPPLLTERETDVLRLVAEGVSNRQLANELGISERTARNHISSILGKLGLESRTQAALWAVREGLVDLPGARAPV